MATWFSRLSAVNLNLNFDLRKKNLNFKRVPEKPDPDYKSESRRAQKPTAYFQTDPKF